MWNKSELQKCIEDGTIKLPMNDALSVSYPNMPYVFLGDDALLDERVGKPIQHKNCVGRVRKSWKKSLIGIKLSSNTKFPYPTRFSIFSQILRSAKPIQHFIQHGKIAMLDEMLDWFASDFKITR